MAVINEKIDIDRYSDQIAHHEGWVILRFVSLRTKLIVATTFLILIPILLVFAYSYNEFEKVLKYNIAESTKERLNQININIEQELRSMMSASSSFVLDGSIREVLNHPPANQRDVLDNVNLFNEKILEISTSIITDSVYIAIIDKYGNYYANWSQKPASYDRIEHSGFYKKALEQDGYMTWEMNHANYVNPNEENLVTLAMTIRDSSFSENIGMLIISKPASVFLDILKNDYLGNLGFILDREGRIIAKDEGAINQSLPIIKQKLIFRIDQFSYSLQDEEVEVFTNYIPLTEWLIVQIVPDKLIYNKITTIRNRVILILCISLLVFTSLIIALSTMLTRSIKRLQITMNQVESGNLNVKFNTDSRDEVGLLGRSFNKMLKRIQDHIDKEITLESSKEKAKLEALQAQINPHFLHNTLHTIKMMSIMAGTKSITEMLLSLGHLLNMSIHRGQELITVEEELKNVRTFLTIQKYRFGDKINVIEQIDPEILDAIVPKLSLQPLVENVYQHGLFIHGGSMTIHIERMGTNICLSIIDNGEALAKDTLQDINSRLQDKSLQNFSGIGLQNVHKRIQMIFGNAYGLTINRNDEQSTTSVSILLPYWRGSDEAASNHN